MKKGVHFGAIGITILRKKKTTGAFPRKPKGKERRKLRLIRLRSKPYLISLIVVTYLFMMVLWYVLTGGKSPTMAGAVRHNPRKPLGASLGES
jgi:hypothetical protein